MVNDKGLESQNASRAADGSFLANIQDMLVRLLEFSIQPLLVADASTGTLLFANRAFTMWAGLSPATGVPLSSFLDKDGVAAMAGQWDEMLQAERSMPHFLLDASMESMREAEKQTDIFDAAPWHTGIIFSDKAEPATMRVVFVSSCLNVAVILIRPQNSWLMYLPNFSFLDAAIMDFPGVISYTDPQGRYLVFNHELERLSGLDDARIRGKSQAEVLPEDMARQIEAIDERMRLEKRRITTDMQWKRADGTSWHRVVREPVYDRGGRLIGVFSMATDITDRYMMEKALSGQDRLMQAVSRSAQLLLASEADDFRKTVDNILSTFGEATDTQRVYVWSFYPEKSDGGTLHASQIYMWASNAELEENGRAVRQRAVEKDSPEWYASMRQGASVQSLVREIPGERGEELVRMGVVSILLIPILIQGELWGFIGFDDCSNERRWSPAEVDILTAAGNLIGMATENYYTGEKLRTANQRLHNSLTNANRLAAEAKQADQLKSAFLANVSHEIRTPMNAIMGLSRLVMEELPEGKHRDYLRQIETAGQTLLKLIEDILDVSQVESGEMALERVRFNLDECMNSMVALMQPKARQAGLGLEFEVESNVPRFLLGDESRLIQVLTNLLDNAVKFTRNGSITVRVRLRERSGDGVVLLFEVADTGIGIPEERRKDIFAAFSQADGSYTRKYGGTGLGLAISASLVNMMDGEIHCQDNPGGGSIFTFTARLELSPENPVPLAVAQEAEVGLSSAGSNAFAMMVDGGRGPDLRTLSGARALVVEDNEINQMIMSSLLEEVGMKITLAGNGLEALKKLNEAEFDVVLMDIQMPEMDGLTATSHIRADGRFDSLPILAVSAHALPSDYQKSVAAGMNGHVTKPVDPAVLYTELTRWVTDHKHPF